ncbi:hypothetical protein ACJ73_02425 [Blastomyces percursus]|uniref:Uncharacterized protein n=1 Tax=Blastomyces percursus TaxID=1658174 RepID=A0A1J9QDL9_9EURO|nr:hypothetical protein ACJ73_02425 [Blastomyces percursus]
MSAFLEDAKRFILKVRKIADEASLQLYCSGLNFSPRKAIIREYLQHEIGSWISQLPHVEDTESAGLECHSDWVELVNFSPDSRVLASDSRDTTVRLWATHTGALHHILEGH